MKNISVVLVIIIMMIFAARYSYQIYKKEIIPTLSTWFIFLLGTGLSLITYAIAEKSDFRSGILNTADVAVVIVILVSIIIWGDKTTRLKRFEKWYLGGIGIVIVYGFVSGDAWSSNVFTQLIIGIGYIPTIQNLVKIKRNVESYVGWGCGAIAGFIALSPAIMDGNSLAILYSTRTIILTLSIISLMIYYKLR